MLYRHITLFMLLTITLHYNNILSMQLACANPNETVVKTTLLRPYFYLVHSDEDLKSAHTIKLDGYFAFPTLAHNFINSQLYKAQFEQIICANLEIAKTKNIPQKIRDRYALRLQAEKYCIEYDIKTTKDNCLYSPNKKCLLSPTFHPVYNNNDIAECMTYDEKNFFYSYPEPLVSTISSVIDILLYKRTVRKTLKVNVIMAHERGLDNINVIQPYIYRILAHTELTAYNLEITQSS